MFIGEISALLTAIVWSVSSYFFVAATVRLGSVTVNFMRLFISLILFALTILIFRIDVNLSSYQWWMFMASGVTGLIIGDAFLFKSFEYLSARISTLVTSFAPAVAAVMAFIFLGERLSYLNILGMIISLSGIVLVVFRKEENTGNAKTVKDIRKGVLLAFLYSIGQSGGLIFAKSAFQESEVNSIVATAVRIFPSVIVLLPYFLFKERNHKMLKIFRNDLPALRNLIIATFLSAYIGLVLMFIAVTHTGIAIASTMIATIPIIQLVISRYFFKEKLTWRSIAGAFITVGGMIIIFWH